MLRYGSVRRGEEKATRFERETPFKDWNVVNKSLLLKHVGGEEDITLHEHGAHRMRVQYV